MFFLSIKEEKNKEERGKAESIPLQMESLSVTQKLQEKWVQRDVISLQWIEKKNTTQNNYWQKKLQIHPMPIE